MWTSCKPWYFWQNWEINTGTLQLAKLSTSFGFQSGFPEIFFSVPRSHLGSSIALSFPISLVFSDLWGAFESLLVLYALVVFRAGQTSCGMSPDLSVTTVSGLDRGCGFLVRTPKSWSPILIAPYGGAGGIHTTWLVVFPFVAWLHHVSRLLHRKLTIFPFLCSVPWRQITKSMLCLLNPFWSTNFPIFLVFSFSQNLRLKKPGLC